MFNRNQVVYIHIHVINDIYDVQEDKDKKIDKINTSKYIHIYIALILYIVSFFLLWYLYSFMFRDVGNLHEIDP